jgi:ATP-binding cassette subfamily C protein CydC
LAGEISAPTELPAIIAVSVVGFYTSIGLANNFTDYRVSLIAARRLFAMMKTTRGSGLSGSDGHRSQLIVAAF